MSLKYLKSILITFVCLNSVILAQSNDYIIPNISYKKILGKIVFHQDSSAFSVGFVQRGYSDTVRYSLKEIKEYSYNDTIYEQIIVPPEVSNHGAFFAKRLITGCITLFELTLDSKKHYLVRKSEYIFVALNEQTIRRSGKKFFKEQKKLANKFASGSFTMDSVISAVNQHNQWLAKNNYPCSYKRSTGFVRWWEGLGLAVDLGGQLNNISGGFWNDFYSWGGSYHYGASFDFAHHYITLAGGRQHKYFQRTNEAFTKSYFKQNDWYGGIRLNYQHYNNPFNKTYLLANGFSSIVKRSVLPIECDADDHFLGDFNGNGWEVGIGRLKNGWYYELTYSSYSYNAINAAQGIADAIASGVDVKGLNEKTNYQSINLKVGWRISLVPLIRQYKQF